MTGGAIPAQGYCTVTVSVTAANPGCYVNTLPVGALQTSNGSNAAPAMATLNVAAKPVAPTLKKVFGPASVKQSQLSLLTITLSNAGATKASLTAPLVDQLPLGVLVAGYANTTCYGTVSAPIGGSKVTLTGGAIPARGSCTVTVKVSAKVKGSYVNKLAPGALRTNNGSNVSAATATLTVVHSYGWVHCGLSAVENKKPAVRFDGRGLLSF